jgi:hypothetical protein
MTDSKTIKRLYLVKGPHGAALVKATGHSQAIRHVSAGLFKSRIPTTIEVADLVAAGAKVQVAGETNEAELPLVQKLHTKMVAKPNYCNSSAGAASRTL